MYLISFNGRTRTWRKHSLNQSGILIVRGRLVEGRRNGFGLVFFIRNLGRMEGFMSSIYYPPSLSSHFFAFLHPPSLPASQQRKWCSQNFHSLDSPAPSELTSFLSHPPLAPPHLPPTPQKRKRKLTNIKNTLDGTHITSSPSPASPTQAPLSLTPNP